MRKTSARTSEDARAYIDNSGGEDARANIDNSGGEDTLPTGVIALPCSVC